MKNQILKKFINTVYRYIKILNYLYKSDKGWAIPVQQNFQHNVAAAAAKSLQSCPTLRDPIDSSPPGSPVPGIIQARTLEWVAISFSNA